MLMMSSQPIGCSTPFRLASAMMSMASPPPIRGAIDLSFSEQMSAVEHRSLSQQIIRVFGLNRAHAAPLSLSLTSLATARQAAPTSLPAEMHLKAWETSDLASSGLYHAHDEAASAVWPAADIVWLSPDAEEPLTSLEPGSVYVLGGLIDRSVLKGASLRECTRQGATRVRRLPLREFAPRPDVHPILSLPACWSILADVNGGASWEEAIAAALPARYVARRAREAQQREALLVRDVEQDADASELSGGSAVG